MSTCDAKPNGRLPEMLTTAGRPLCLRFSSAISPVVQARLRYAFRVFAAVYGHGVIEKETAGAICLHYGAAASSVTKSDNVLMVPARYRLRSPMEPPPLLVSHRYSKESFFLFFGVDEATGHPDWLGEIFEWLSSSHEIRASARDPVGRIPFSETLFARQDLSPRRPHASLIMAWLSGALHKDIGRESLHKAPCPIPGTQHLVVSSHDIDFYYATWTSAMIRLVKNVVLSFRLYRSWDFFRWNAAKILQLLRGKQIAAYLPALLEASQACGFQSTLFVVSKRMHRRDPNYALQQLVPVLRESLDNGFSIGVHGCYQSIIEEGSLKGDVAAISEALGARPLGGRQHWLRFDRHQKLFETIEDAGLLYDSTLGFSDTVGFRNGASFAFPPYDFRHERAHEFLEIPLVLMDGSLEAVCRSSGEQPALVAEEVLQASRKWGWGGVAVDWHNPMEPIQVPAKINDVFWESVRNKVPHNEKWIDGNQLFQLCIRRYHAAGLLQSVPCDA